MYGNCGETVGSWNLGDRMMRNYECRAIATVY